MKGVFGVFRNSAAERSQEWLAGKACRDLVERHKRDGLTLTNESNSGPSCWFFLDGKFIGMPMGIEHIAEFCEKFPTRFAAKLASVRRRRFRTKQRSIAVRM